MVGLDVNLTSDRASAGHIRRSVFETPLTQAAIVERGDVRPGHCARSQRDQRAIQALGNSLRLPVRASHRPSPCVTMVGRYARARKLRRFGSSQVGQHEYETLTSV